MFPKESFCPSGNVLNLLFKLSPHPSSSPSAASAVLILGSLRRVLGLVDFTRSSSLADL